MKLKNIDPLRYRRPGPEDQLLVSPTIPKEPWRVGTQRKVDADRSDRCTVSKPESECLHGIIEILEIPLPPAQADVIDAAIPVAHVVEQDAAYIFADQREPQ